MSNGSAIFIHGIGNQLSPQRLLNRWTRAMEDGGDGVDFDLFGVDSSIVYWADVMYAVPTDQEGEEESVEFEGNVLEGVTSGEIEDFDESYLESAEGAEKEFLDKFINKYNLDAEESESFPKPDEVPEGTNPTLEAVPLPWFVKKPLMRRLLRDVHHYLFNAEHSPRSGETFRVQDEIRERFVRELEAATPPRTVIAHSLGTVIAYDCLKRVDDCPEVASLVTIGSPLGLSEVQDQLEPEYSRRDGFPAKLGAWYNRSDRLDPVCGFDAKLADEFRRAGTEVIDDDIVENHGWARHPATKYFRQRSVQQAVLDSIGG